VLPFLAAENSGFAVKAARIFNACWSDSECRATSSIAHAAAVMRASMASFSLP
jgi:hypothetical protein